MIIKKLDLYIIRLFIIPFLIIYSLIFIIFMIQFFWSQIDELTDKHISVPIILKFILYFGMSILPLITPIALLLTSIIIFGNLSESQELIAIKSSGISLFRVMIPILWITFFLSIVLYLFSDFVIPKAKMKAKKLGYRISLTCPFLKLKEGNFVNLLPNFFIKIEKIDRKSENKNYLREISIFFYGKNLLFNTIFSKKGILIPNDEFIQLKLMNGILYSENFNEFKKEQSSYQIIEFDTLIKNLKKPSEPSESKIINLYDYDFYQTLNTKNLIKKIKFLKEKNYKNTYKNKIYLSKLQLEFQKKFTFPITCIIMFLTGAPLGAIIRKGGIGYSTMIALIIFIIYYTLLTITQNKVEKAEICPWIGAWIPNFVFFPISIWITYKTVMDDF
ncbi:LptF/LptG family permease [Blattabacterium cuenoti]|uniref:LptF/LptG family permease n=1 Tax=Blattabacterium cuenoti TaxID=1653831 RepID=UPI00163C9761|nr:LptF/LptG family permease [Blattabacterium cuenoti]